MKRFFIFVSALFCCSGIFAEFNKFGVPDTTEIRSTIIDSWLKANIDVVRRNESLIMKNPIGEEFQVRLEETDDTFAIIVAPFRMVEMTVYTENGIEEREMPMYPGDAKGGWALVRSSKTGKPLFIRMFFTADSDVYVQFTPEKNRTLADFVISGLYAARSVPVGINFESLYENSLQSIYNLTKNTLPWQYATSTFSDYRESLKIISVIRKNLDRIVKTEDAAYDENFKPVKISDGKPRKIEDSEKKENLISLSDAGFAKWIVDGLVEPITGGGIYMKPLTQPTVTFKQQGLIGITNEKYSTEFTLDWVRNLASAWFSAQKGKTYHYNETGLDVTLEPFAGVSTDSGIAQVFGYTKDTGYLIKNIRALLYVLAQRESNYFYIGAIRREAPVSVKKGVPNFVFDRTAIFFPYFTEDGRFDCIVFENGEEIPFKTFVEQNKKNFVHFSRFMTSEKFFLQ